MVLGRRQGWGRGAASSGLGFPPGISTKTEAEAAPSPGEPDAARLHGDRSGGRGLLPHPAESARPGPFLWEPAGGEESGRGVCRGVPPASPPGP